MGVGVAGVRLGVVRGCRDDDFLGVLVFFFTLLAGAPVMSSNGRFERPAMTAAAAAFLKTVV